jgi:hypothetical protein
MQDAPGFYTWREMLNVQHIREHVEWYTQMLGTTNIFCVKITVPDQNCFYEFKEDYIYNRRMWKIV